MKVRVRFWRWTGSSAAAGFLLPLCFCIHWFVFKGYGTELEARLWPSSLMFMALDSPALAATSTVIIVYLVALLENVLLYAVIGALVWLMMLVARFAWRRRMILR